MNQAEYVIGLDVGGTKIRTRRDRCTGDLSSPLQPDSEMTRMVIRHEENIIPQILTGITTVLPTSGKLRAIGISAPGPIDATTKEFGEIPSLPTLRGVNLADVVARHFGVPARIERDTVAALYGECSLGAGRVKDNVAYVTVSTGIGAAVKLGGKVIFGQGSAGELGHITLIPGGPVCACGRRGHLEALASGKAIAAIAQERLISEPGSLILTLAHGDPLAGAIIHEAAEHLGRGLANLLLLYNPEMLILGGGVWLGAHELLYPPMMESLRDSVVDPERFVDRCEIVTSRLGDQVSLWGAAALALDCQ